MSTGEPIFLPHGQCVYCNDEIPGECSPECHPKACQTLSAFITGASEHDLMNRLQENQPPPV